MSFTPIVCTPNDSPYLPKKGIKLWARVYEKTSLGPTTRICHSARIIPILTHLRGKTLEESADTLLLDHLSDDGHAADLRVEVGVLDSGLDDVQGRGDGDGSDGTGDRGDKVCGCEGSRASRVVGARSARHTRGNHAHSL